LVNGLRGIGSSCGDIENDSQFPIGIQSKRQALIVAVNGGGLTDGHATRALEGGWIGDR
jgi:hypothetical protein